jgi:hypothetical protein
VGLGLAAIASPCSPPRTHCQNHPSPLDKVTALHSEATVSYPKGKVTALHSEATVSYPKGKVTATPHPRATARVPSPHQPCSRPYKTLLANETNRRNRRF